MAVFLVNTCKFSNCGLTFPTLTELIRHIEDVHLDFDPRSIEQHEQQQPPCLPISYILRVFTDGSKKESGLVGTHSVRKTMRAHSPVSSLCSTTPTGSEMDEEDNESDSAESAMEWANQDTDPTNGILKMMNPTSSSNTSSTNTNVSAKDIEDKPFVCAIEGCKRRYRNMNGLRNHKKLAHKTNTTNAQVKKEIVGPTKVYKCECGKIYKTPHGLKNHTKQHHHNSVSQTPTITLSQHSQTSPQSTSPLPTNVSPMKDNILATFVHMKHPLPITCASSTALTSTTTLSMNRTIGNLPLMVTIQTEKENKSLPLSKEKREANEKEIKTEIIQTETATSADNKKSPPISLQAPTLQQHLLSPIIVKSSPN